MVVKATKKKGAVKVGKLKVNKETVKILSTTEAKKIKGGGTGTCEHCHSGVCDQTAR